MANTTKFNVEVGMYANKQDFNKFNKDLEHLLLKIKEQANAQTDPKIKKELNEQFKIIEKMSLAYEQAFNSKTGQVNIQKLNQEMQKANVTVQQFYNAMSKSGQEGAIYYNQWANSILNANVQLKQSNQLLDKMAVTFKNTIRYGISSSIFNNFTNSIQKAYNYTKNLDTSLNDIRIVSSQSADQMERLAVSANRAAKELGKTTLDYTKAATIYYQQGLPSDEVEKRTQATLKAANVTGQNAQEVSEQLTAVWNGYRVTGRELELYVDKLAAVAAHSASNLEELSTGMSKVASAANLMGVDIDQLNAQMSTIISVTRQAPESVGTALRTIYARIADIKAGLDDDVSLGNYSGKMAKLGFNVLDASGNLKDMGDVIEEIGGKWQDLTREQQISLAQTMAGTRQYNNLLTLFDNWDKYTDALETSKNSAGELQRQQDIYMESTQAHLEQLQATAEETYSALFDQESARDFIDLVTGGLSTINKYLNGLNTKALGGVLGQLGALGANLFSNQIASGISTGLENKRKELANTNVLKLQSDILDHGVRGSDEGEYKYTAKSKYFDNRKNLLDASKGLGVEKYNELIDKTKKIQELSLEVSDQEAEWEKNKERLVRKQEQLNALEKEYAEIQEKIQRKESLTKEEGSVLKEREQILKDMGTVQSRMESINADSGGKLAERDALQEEVDAAAQLGQEQQRINDIIRGTTALLGTWNNLQAGISIATDDSLSAWEKFQGLIGVAATQGMLFLTSADSLSRLLPSLVVQFGLLTKEEAADLTLKKLLTGEVKLNIAANLKKIITDKLLTAGVITQTEAENGYNIALAITKLLTGDVSGLSLLAAAAIVALTAAMVAGTIALIDANTGLNYYNKQIDKAAENTKKAKEEFNELKETFDAYKEARNGIDGLTVGTLEYYDAMVKANEEAQKLIDKLGLIVGTDYTISEGGLIKIDDKKLEELQFKEQQKVFQASAIEYQKRFDKAEYQRLEAGKKLDKAVKKQYPGEEKKITKDRITQESQKTMGEKLPLASFEKEKIELDITDWQIAEKAVYSQAEEEAIQLKRMLADQIIRGYASQMDVASYDKMNSAGKKIIQDAVAETAEKNKTNSAIEQDLVSLYEKIPVVGELWSGASQWIADNLPSGPMGKALSIFPTLGLPGITGITGVYDKFQEREIKEEYLKNVQGIDISKMSGEDLKKLRDDTRLDTALEALRNGTKEAIDTQKQLTNIYNEALKTSSDIGISKTAQEYYANMKTAFASGDLDAARNQWGKLTDEERSKLAGQDEVLADKIYYGDLDATQTTNEAITRGIEDNDRYNETLKEQAQALETSATALKLYGAAMRNANKLSEENNEETADAIANSYKFNKAYNDAVKIYKNNTDAIKDWTKAWKNHDMVSYETADAMAELTDEVSKIMGYDVSPDFMVDNIDTIKTMLTGTAEEAQKAYEILQTKGIGDVLKSQFGEDTINSIFTTQNALDEFSRKIANLKTGDELTGSFKENLITMVNASNMTAEQIEKLFANMHLKVPKLTVKKEVVQLPEEKRHHRYDGTIIVPDQSAKNGYREEDVHYGWWETTDAGTATFASIDDNVEIKSTGGAATVKGNFAKAPSNTGGSKSKKGSTAKPSKKDPNKQELDRYQLVNVQLKEISKELTKLDKQKKKLLGGNLVKNLNQQIKLLNDQIDVTDAKLKIAEKERAEKAKTLSGYGAKFDAQGNVYNYETIFKQEQARLNKVYAKYNKMSKAQQEKYESTVKSAEERFKKFNETISRYNTLNSDLIPELQQNKIDAQDKITEDLIEEFNMEVKVRLDLADAKKEWNEFTRKYLKGWKDNDVDKWASGLIEDFSLLINGNEEEGFGGTLIEAVNQLSKFQEEFERITSEDKVGDWYRDNAAQFKEDWKGSIEEAQERYKQLQEIQDQMNEYFIQMMNLTQEKFDEQLDNFEAINKQIEHNLSLIDLLYGEDSYDKIEEQQRASRDNSIEQLAYLKQQKDYYDDLLATLNEEDEAWQEAKEGAQAANEALTEGLSNSLEEAKEAFESGVAAVIKDMTDTLTNGKGFDLINKQWELMNENSQLELDNINRMQGLQDIAKKYNDAINNTSNVKAQKELAEIRDREIEQLKEIDHLSQEDLERAEKKLEIAKAQIALEDAQQNKTQMRLRRDSQGNYRYQFVANEDQVNQARDQLAAAYNSLYNFDKQRALQNNQEMISTTQQYFEEIANLRIRYGDDEEKYKEEKRILDEQYNEKMAILEEHRLLNEKNLNESTFADLNNLYAQNANNYELMTDAQKAALNSFEAANQTAFDLIFGLETENTEAFRNMADEEKRVIEEELIPQWNSGVDEMINKLTEEGGFEQVATKIWNDITEKIKEYFKSIKKAEETSGKTFEELLSSENSIIKQNEKWIESNEKLIKSFVDKTKSVEKDYETLKKLLGIYDSIIGKEGQVIETNQKLYEQFTTEEADSIRDTLEDQPTSGGTGDFNQPTEPEPEPKTEEPKKDTKPSIPFDGTLPKGTQLYNASGGKYNKTQAARTVTVTADAGSRYQVWGSTFNPHTVYIDKKAIKYDTGGYTGEWGNGGRLALLHQKELVLNRKDTANMLNAVEVLRGITDNIGADLLGRMANMTAGGFNSAVGGNALEQNVHIEATFPGVKSSIEIQDALNNLVNMAAQRAQSR